MKWEGSKRDNIIYSRVIIVPMHRIKFEYMGEVKTAGMSRQGRNTGV